MCIHKYDIIACCIQTWLTAHKLNMTPYSDRWKICLPCIAYISIRSGNAACSVHGNVKTSLLHLVFYKTSLFAAQVVKNLTQHPFQRVVSHNTPFWSVRILYRFIPVVAYVESRTVKMAAVLCGCSL